VTQALAAFLLMAGPVVAQATVRASVDSFGAEANNNSGTITYTTVVSGDGQVIAFESAANNLVSGDTNKRVDVFVHDRSTGTTERVSVDSIGSEGNDPSFYPSVSADGRFVAFCSDATNLVPGDSNGWTDVFVHDRVMRSTIRASVDSLGFEANGNSAGVISPDGRFVVFASDADNLVPFDFNSSADIFIFELSTGTVDRVSVDSSGVEGNGGSYQPCISADSHIVAYYSFSSNLVSGDTNGQTDVFVRDRTAGTTERVSVDSLGIEGNGHSEFAAVSFDGQLVAFESFADNLISGDTNAQMDVFVHDRSIGTTQRVSVDSLGNEGNGGSYGPRVSADGSTVTFDSAASNLVGGDTNGWGDVFARDQVGQTTFRVSVDSAGGEGNGNSFNSALSDDGQVIAFESFAANLVIGDSNVKLDVFARDLRLQAATSTNYGVGVSGSFGVPTLTSRLNPVLGTNLEIDVGNSCGSDTIGLFFLGLTAGQLHTNYGGDVLLFPLIVNLVGIPSGGLALSSHLPRDPGLAGFHVYLQVVEGDPGAVKRVSFTQGLDLQFGY
jgi:Tol biopolymer transport system component